MAHCHQFVSPVVNMAAAALESENFGFRTAPKLLTFLAHLSGERSEMSGIALRRGFDFGFRLAACLLAVVASVAATSTRAYADELDALHQQILQNPKNSELNLRFAQLAESSGHLRWALAAYERVVLNDPDNFEAQKALQRIHRALQPDLTLLSLQYGGRYESNPRYYLTPHRGEAQAFGSAALVVERTFNGTRWRTNGAAVGLLHQKEGDLNYGSAGLDTGPVLDVYPGWALHPAIGGSAAYYDRHFYYGEGSVGATLDSNINGIYRALQVRGAYRSYDQFFPSSNGFYVEVRGKLAVPNVLGSGSAGIVSPWVLWSDISGTASVLSPVITELQPGAYFEWGSKFELVRSVSNWLVLSASVAVSERNYRNDIVVSSGDKRRDWIVSPAASVTFPNLFAYRKGLRLEYRYIRDESNDPTKDFDDHIVSASVVSLFDPTRSLSSQNGR